MSGEQGSEQFESIAVDIATVARITRLENSIKHLARLASRRTGLRETLSQIAELVVRAVPGADGAGITVFEPHGDNTLVATAPFVAAVDAVQYAIGSGPCITAAATSSPSRANRLGKDPRWVTFGSTAARMNVNSALSLPLITSNGVLGTINIYAHRKHAFTHSALAKGQAYAASAAIAVQDAHLPQATMESDR